MKWSSKWLSCMISTSTVSGLLLYCRIFNLVLPGWVTMPYINHCCRGWWLRGVSVATTYRIALNFRGSKFSQTAIFEDFMEIICKLTACTHRTLRVENFHWNIFANGWKFAKFAKLKTCENLALYRYKLVWICHLLMLLLDIFLNTGTSPHIFMKLSAGSHMVKVVPIGCGRNRRPVSTSFVVWNYVSGL